MVNDKCKNTVVTIIGICGRAIKIPKFGLEWLKSHHDHPKGPESPNLVERSCSPDSYAPFGYLRLVISRICDDIAAVLPTLWNCNEERSKIGNCNDHTLSLGFDYSFNHFKGERPNVFGLCSE
jgi:hypothetical protein